MHVLTQSSTLYCYDHMVIGFTTTYAISACSCGGILDAIISDQVYQWLAAGRWFSQDTPLPPSIKLKTMT